MPKAWYGSDSSVEPCRPAYSCVKSGEVTRRVMVIDTRPGVAESDLEKIFEPLYRVDPNHPGAGIGLAIAQLILYEAGGDIVATNRPRRGQRVTYT